LNQSNAGRRILSKIMGDSKRHDQRKDKIDKIRSSKRQRVIKVVDREKDDSNTLSDCERTMIAAMVNGVSNASRYNIAANRVLRAQNRNDDSVSGASSVTFDYLGNPL